jgi:hypothetical protein
MLAGTFSTELIAKLESKACKLRCLRNLTVVMSGVLVLPFLIPDFCSEEYVIKALLSFAIGIAFFAKCYFLMHQSDQIKKRVALIKTFHPSSFSINSGIPQNTGTPLNDSLLHGSMLEPILESDSGNHSWSSLSPTYPKK